MPVQPQHVWVEASPGRPPKPGLLLDWRNEGGRWEAYVIYVSFHLQHPVQEPSVHMQWLGAELVTKR